jgi:PKD repeat protein/subtilisin family serine protease
VNDLLGREVQVAFTYKHAYNGVAIFLSPAEAALVAGLDAVVLLYRNGEEELLTDAGPVFIGAHELWGGVYQNLHFYSLLSGANEVPPNGSTASGEAEVTYDLSTGLLTWTISHDIPVPTAAHFHVAPPGVNGGIVIPLDHTVNPMVGSATLTEEQQGWLMNSLLYINIHTAAFPGGEIRDQVWLAGSMGEGVVVGVLDTGINSSHPSFAEVGDDGYIHTNPYGSGNFVGYCVANPSFCNDKLIGAWALHPSSSNPEDTNGHGSHTAGTIAGNILQDVSMYAPTADYDFPFVSGVAPHANIIMYQVCVPSCPTTVTTAAVNQAVIDGVDIINYSISGGNNPYVETTSVAMLNANTAGVLTSASAGNSGPGASTVGHQEPWNITVAASTHNRMVLNSVVDLNSSMGPLPDILGESPTAPYGPAPLVYAGDAPYNNPLCNPFPANTFNGEIVVCDRGVIARVGKGENVLNAGGGGMILANDLPSAASLNADTHVLPATHISYADGLVLKAWMASGTGHTGSITGGSLDYSSSGDNMASFSSRGPAGAAVPGLMNMIKPDVTAPGLNILAPYFAGFSPAPEFNIISGTSMSAPHTAGAAALLRALNSSWSPVEIKSALMLTGLASVNKEDNTTPGDPFDFGAGRVDLTRANQVGFVMDITRAEFDAANPAIGGDPKLLNLPSFASTNCENSCSWTRTVTSVAETSQEYNAWVEMSSGITGTVTPSNFTLAPGASQEVTVTLNVTGWTGSGWAFSSVHLEPVGTEVAAVRMPVAVIPFVTIDPEIEVDPEALHSSQAPGTITSQTLTISNVGVGDLTWEIEIEEVGPEAVILTAISEGFDDILTLVPGGWYMQNNSSPLGTSNWFQGNPTVFSSHQGAPDSYIGANYNNTAGIGTISNWLLTPEITMSNGDTVSFWTRSPASDWEDRLQVRLSTSGDSTNVGTGAFDVGDFTTLLLDINPTYAPGGYPTVWTEFVITLSDLSGPTNGRIGLRYFVENGGPSGSNSDYIGIDTFEYISTSPTVCGEPAGVSWLNVDPASGTTPAGESDEVTVTFDSDGLTPGETYEANLCISSNDVARPMVVVPVTLEILDGEMPSAAFSFAPSVPLAGETVQFTNLTTGTDPISYEWDFGDGTVSSEVNPTHSYETGGVYTITLTATNDFGMDEHTAQITVADLPTSPLLTLELSVEPDPVILHQPATFTAVVTNISDEHTVEGVMASGVIPDFVTVVAYSDECEVVGGVLTCDLGEARPR